MGNRRPLAYPESHTKIFNADGLVMFSNMGYTAQLDGIYKGKEMPLGAYYYIISLNDGSGKKLNGYFTIKTYQLIILRIQE